MAVVSTVEDRMCIQKDGSQVFHFSAQDVISCDRENYYCNGGYVTYALNYGISKGFIREENFPWTGQNTTCPDIENQERQNGDQAVLAGYCAVQGIDSIKQQIIEEGPVIAPLTAYTDFLTYSDGTYYPTQGAFKFNGQNVVKIIGWGRDVTGEYWIVQGAWGQDWGNNGYAQVLAGKQELGIDMFAIAPIVTTMTFSEQQKFQQEQSNINNAQEYEDIPNERIEVDQS